MSSLGSRGRTTRRQVILERISDLAADFMYYDRKEDESLGRGEIEEAVQRREITWDEIVEEFRKGISA